MSEDGAFATGSVIGIFIFIGLLLLTIFLSVDQWHSQVASANAKWPTHQGTITQVHGQATITPNGSSINAVIAFRDFHNNSRSTDIDLPYVYAVGNHIAVRVSANGAAYIPDAHYHGLYGNPINYGENLEPIWIIFVGVCGNIAVSWFLGFLVFQFCYQILPKYKGKLGTR